MLYYRLFLENSLHPHSQVLKSPYFSLHYNQRLTITSTFICMGSYEYFHCTFGELSHTSIVRCQLNLIAVKQEYECWWGWPISLWVTTTNLLTHSWNVQEMTFLLIVLIVVVMPSTGSCSLVPGTDLRLICVTVLTHCSGDWFGNWQTSKITTVIILSAIILIKLAVKEAEYSYNHLSILELNNRLLKI